MTSLLPIPIKMEMFDSYRSLPEDGTDFIRSKNGAKKDWISGGYIMICISTYAKSPVFMGKSTN